MISDSDALLIAGDVLAGFLEENLPKDDRWSKHIRPALREVRSPAEMDLQEFDLSGLIQIFLGNKDYFRTAGVFRTSLPIQLAICVRHMRNSRAHQSRAVSITDDERLFDLHALRRFILVIDNRVTQPRLAEELVDAINTNIVQLTNRCLGETFQVNWSETSEAERPKEEGKEEKTDYRVEIQSMQSTLAVLDGRLSKVLEESGVTEAKGGLGVARELASICIRLEAIDAKLDKALLAPEPDLEDNSFPPVDVAPEHLSRLEAKAALRSLRSQLDEEYPDVDPVRNLLRQSMVDQMLLHRIESVESFDQKIPVSMKDATDKRHFRLLPQVFGIIKRLR